MAHSRSDTLRFALLRGTALAGCTAVLLLAASVADAQRRGDPHDDYRDPWAPPELPEMLEYSETVVAGEVLEMESRWTPDRSSIFTTITFRVDRRFKGAGQSVIRFRIPGGTVGDTQVLVTHHAQFRVGERALVFLGGRSGRLPEVVAGEAGKRHLRPTEDGSERILPGFALAEPSPGVPPRGISTLDDLAAAVPRLEAARRN